MSNENETVSEMRACLLAPLTEDQRRILIVVAETEHYEGVSPTLQYVEQKTGVDVRSILGTFPRVGLFPGLSYGALIVENSGLLSDESKLGLTLFGCRQILGQAGISSSLFDRFLDCLNLLVLKAKDYEPDHRGVSHPSVTFEEIRELYRSGGFAEPRSTALTVSRLIFRELMPYLGSGGKQADDDWKYEINLRMKTFEGIDTFDAYLDHILGKFPSSKPASVKSIDAKDVVPTSIFLSYSHADAGVVRRFSKGLTDLGYRVWIDEGELLIGDSLIVKITEAIDRVDFLVAFVSPESVKSSWCQKEIAQAADGELGFNGVVVMPCLLDDAEIPPLLKGKLYLDLSKKSDAESVSELHKSILGHLNPKAPLPPRRIRADGEGTN